MTGTGAPSWRQTPPAAKTAFPAAGKINKTSGQLANPSRIVRPVKRLSEKLSKWSDRFIITGSMMTESERKVVVWQFGQIVDCWGHERQSVRWEMIRGAVGEEAECQTFALLTQPETKRVVLRRKDGEKLRKFDSDTDTAPKPQTGHGQKLA